MTPRLSQCILAGLGTNAALLVIGVVFLVLASSFEGALQTDGLGYETVGFFFGFGIALTFGSLMSIIPTGLAAALYWFVIQRWPGSSASPQFWVAPAIGVAISTSLVIIVAEDLTGDFLVLATFAILPGLAGGMIFRFLLGKIVSA
ncbi:hypothetical protein SAMN04488030_1874 [Aliiroseovarius halocynthiae]|uniref:Uncharacterized protein n=1 Tax=Aliiroseovarius halocynthiae TaxID=985055 RepID=A0A545SR19_9RHOB|nr:hypothetical protein [Aliiroseovarius halocynthiae]TQV67404.1 hypothetical protein FIL88_09235 [Aliiroseovarius halocynthiae]SMR81379.1 hypothetical protein SAMN04488030_1874 [Aliiroseovarius halocynthiae]